MVRHRFTLKSMRAQILAHVLFALVERGQYQKAALKCQQISVSTVKNGLIMYVLNSFKCSIGKISTLQINGLYILDYMYTENLIEKNLHNFFNQTDYCIIHLVKAKLVKTKKPMKYV